MGLVIFTYIYNKNQPNVGKYTYPMDGMGDFFSFFARWSKNHQSQHRPCPQVPLNGDRDVVTITFGTGEISGVFMKDGNSNIPRESMELVSSP